MKPIIDILPELRRPFAPSKVSWKIQNVKGDNTAALVVAFIDARDVSERLNTVAPGQWSNKHEPLILEGKLEGVECTITLRDGDTSIQVQDVGIGAPIEQDMKTFERDVRIKTYWSDSFKRAGVKLGIAESLYELPQIWLNEDNLYKKDGDIKGIDKTGNGELAQRYQKWVNNDQVIEQFGEVYVG